MSPEPQTLHEAPCASAPCAPEASPTGSPGIGHNGPPSEIENLAFWHELIAETEAADFLDLTPRSMQAMRQRGGGPLFFRLSARCVKYTRFRCKAWYDARMRSSTSDPGAKVA